MTSLSALKFESGRLKVPDEFSDLAPRSRKKTIRVLVSLRERCAGYSLLREDSLPRSSR